MSLAITAADGVVAAAAFDLVEPAIAGQQVAGFAAQQALEGQKLDGIARGVGARGCVGVQVDRQGGGSAEIAQRVDARAAVERVGACAALDDVIALVAEDLVGVRAAGQLVVKLRATQDLELADGILAGADGVLLGGDRKTDGDARGRAEIAQRVAIGFAGLATREDVVTRRAAVDRIIAAVACERVVALAAIEDVVGIVAGQRVVAGAADDIFEARECVDVAGNSQRRAVAIGIQRYGGIAQSQMRQVQRVVAVAAVQGVVALATLDDVVALAAVDEVVDGNLNKVDGGCVAAGELVIEVAADDVLEAAQQVAFRAAAGRRSIKNRKDRASRPRRCRHSSRYRQLRYCRRRAERRNCCRR